MRADADRNEALVALKLAAIATRNSARNNWVPRQKCRCRKRHPRLLQFIVGNEDYESCTFDVLRKLRWAGI